MSQCQHVISRAKNESQEDLQAKVNICMYIHRALYLRTMLSFARFEQKTNYEITRFPYHRIIPRNTIIFLSLFLLLLL